LEKSRFGTAKIARRAHPSRFPKREKTAFTMKQNLFALALAALLLTPISGLNAADKARPNILFIIVDDQSPFDLKVYDPKSTLEAPNIERLAAQGMVFDGAYHMGSFSGAVCTPSRHMVMSGRTVWHLPIGPATGGGCPPNLEQNTIPAVFNRAGYATMRTCKQGNSYEAANKLFTVRHDAVKRGGTAETGSAWHAEQVLNYLGEREKAKARAPFLIYFGFSHPHDVRDGTPELLAKYGATNHTDKKALPAANPRQPKLPPNYLPAHPFNHGNMGVRDEVSVSGVWGNRDERTIRNELGREFACSENIDIQIGRVLAKLEAMGELENTYIVYTSDHGMAIGRHGLQGKQNLYEHTWRVPFIVKGPGIKAGSRVQGNIFLLDTLATMCDLAGIPAPESNQGLSFKPVLEGKKETVRDVLYGVYSGGDKPGMRSVRKGDWKLIKYDVADGGVHETQLFNLAENPGEFLPQHHAPAVIALTGVTPTAVQTNLAADPKHAEKLAEMEALLLAEMRRLKDPHRLWNQPDDGLAATPEEKAKPTRALKRKAKEAK
jgi:choline-sulfatase